MDATGQPYGQAEPKNIVPPLEKSRNGTRA